MTINWKSKDKAERLLAATVASLQDTKVLNYQRIASMFGEGATYDSIEGQFRSVRALAKKMREEIENGQRPEAPLRGSKPRASGSGTSTPRKPRTPRNPAGALAGSALTGTGTGSNTPTKRGPRTNTPKSQKAQGVLTGRVSKAAGTPTKRGRKAQAQTESQTQTDIGNWIKKENVKPRSFLDLWPCGQPDDVDVDVYCEGPDSDADAVYEVDNESAGAHAPSTPSRNARQPTTGRSRQKLHQERPIDDDFQDIDSFPYEDKSTSAAYSYDNNTTSQGSDPFQSSALKPHASAAKATQESRKQNPSSAAKAGDGKPAGHSAESAPKKKQNKQIANPFSASYIPDDPSNDVDIDDDANLYANASANYSISASTADPDGAMYSYDSRQNYIHSDEQDDDDDNPGITTSASAASGSGSGSGSGSISSYYPPYEYDDDEDNDVGFSYSSHSHSHSHSQGIPHPMSGYYDDDEDDVAPLSGLAYGYHGYDVDGVSVSGVGLGALGTGTGITGYGYTD